ncbi:MAG: hypothetical protein U5R30_00015 [Deltaproteobacteria bacterium]|jgi:hypothetical protein|nr:hypothetical protein [Deltaproteobacteria bacterium]
MWVFTREGFFSVVWDKTCRPDQLAVRSQSKEDICHLVKRLSGYCDEGQITETFGTAYRYRVNITKQAWSAYLADCALQVDYPSVKEAIVSVDDRLRQEAYYQIWEALYRWRSKTDSAARAQPQPAPSGAGVPALPVRWQP